MPYIKPAVRRELIPYTESPVYRQPRNAGELNFLFTHYIKQYIQDRGMCYQTLNDIVGTLECCKTEFYRRIIVPYEKQKCLTNGDCY
jgi:hypothetical protein